MAFPPHERCTLLASTWTAAAAVAAALGECAEQQGDPWIKRQRDAMTDLAGLLHHMTALNDRRVDEASFRDLWRLLNRRLRQADELSRHGAPLDTLVQIAGPRPRGRLPVSLWSLAWLAVARLSEALDAVIGAHPAPRRIEQAKAVGALEAALRHALISRHHPAAARKAALAAALDAFEAADRAVGGDVAQIFAEEGGCQPRAVLAA